MIRATRRSPLLRMLSSVYLPPWQIGGSENRVGRVSDVRTCVCVPRTYYLSKYKIIFFCQQIITIITIITLLRIEILLTRVPCTKCRVLFRLILEQSQLIVGVYIYIEVIFSNALNISCAIGGNNECYIVRSSMFGVHGARSLLFTAHTMTLTWRERDSSDVHTF